MSLRWPSPRRRASSSAQQQQQQQQQQAAPAQPVRRTSGFGTSSSPAAASSQAAQAQTTQPRRSSNALEQLRGRVRGNSSASLANGNGSSRQAVSAGTRSAPVIHLPSHNENGGGDRANTPPPYAHHSLDRSPLPNPMALDDRPRVPPPIYLRSSSTQPQSKLGSLTIHVPGW